MIIKRYMNNNDKCYDKANNFFASLKPHPEIFSLNRKIRILFICKK